MVEEQNRIEPPADGAGVVTYDLDLETGELKWGEGLYTVLGYDASAPLHTLEWWTDHIHPDDAMILNEALDSLLDPGVQKWTVDYRFQKADRQYARVHDRAVVERDQAGRAIRLAGTIWQS